MGQTVTFVSTNSPRPGIIRFELNRSLTGMGHERYVETDEIVGNRPPDELARRFFGTGKFESVHIYGHVVTAELKEAGDSGVVDAIADLYTYYVPGVEIPSDEELIAMVE